MAKATPASWKKGQSGNPNGRPKKGDSLRAVIDKVLSERKKTFVGEDGKTYRMPEKKEILVRVLVEGAINGNPSMMRELLNRYVGLPVQKIDLDAMLDTPVPVNIIAAPAVNNVDSDPVD